MAYPNASKNAVDKYVKQNYDDIKVRVPKGMRERYKTHAEQKGMSLNAYIINLIETDMKKQGKEV